MSDVCISLQKTSGDPQILRANLIMSYSLISLHMSDVWISLQKISDDPQISHTYMRISLQMSDVRIALQMSDIGIFLQKISDDPQIYHTFLRISYICQIWGSPYRKYQMILRSIIHIWGSPYRRQMWGSPYRKHQGILRSCGSSDHTVYNSIILFIWGSSDKISCGPFLITFIRRSSNQSYKSYRKEKTSDDPHILWT